MKYNYSLFKPIFIIISCLSTWGESPNIELKSFEKDGLTFKYPSDWTLVDKSTAQAQHLVLTREKSSILIMVIAHRELIAKGEQFDLARRGITEPYIESIAKNFSLPGHPAQQDNPCTEIGGVKVPGIRIHGLHKNEQSTGEVYPLVKGQRFVNLVYIRTDRDGPHGDPVWEGIRKTLMIKKMNTEASLASLQDNIISGGVLNGKAISLPKPEYSSFAQGARASGTVNVQVTIGEQGHVITAQPITGHPLLKEAAVEAAKRARFSPTLLCGEAVRVSGIITYNFVPGSGVIKP